MPAKSILSGLLSVIVPVRNEAANIPVFCNRIKKVLDNNHIDWEVIFVEDSSVDKTVELLKKFCSEDKRFCSIFLTRGFGHHEAFTAGIDYCRGDHIIMMDGDLQHPPEFIPNLISAYNEGFDMVSARRITKETFVKQLGSVCLNKFVNTISDYPIQITSSIFRIFSRKVADSIVEMRERNRFLTGLFSWSGFNTKSIDFHEDIRHSGQTKYSLARMFELALNAITSFSIKPLRIGIYIGFFSSLLSFILGLYHILLYATVGVPIQGFTSIVVSIFFMGGLILLVLGIIGEYIGKIFLETKSRPLYIVKDTLNIKL